MRFILAGQESPTLMLDSSKEAFSPESCCSVFVSESLIHYSEMESTEKKQKKEW